MNMFHIPEEVPGLNISADMTSSDVSSGHVAGVTRDTCHY